MQAGAKGRLVAAEKKRASRVAATKIQVKMGRRDVSSLSKRDIFMLGLALYWGEGYKNDNEECGLTNSDPDIIRTFIAWLALIYNISTVDLIARVSINSMHRGRIKQIEKYWSTVTEIPLSQFTAPSMIEVRARKEYPNSAVHFGTLRVKVRRGTSLRRRIMGSINELRVRIK
jgi:hypothetical protein